jgi:sugar phosphate isomerase/epimerase
MPIPIGDLSRLCIHTITTKPWSIEEDVRRYSAAGVKGITVWRQSIEGRDPAETARMIRDHGLSITSLCRGGFFAAATREGRATALDENRRCLDEAAALGAPLVVLVCGAIPGQPLAESRKQIAAAIAELAHHAAETKVRLAIEPLHPMYADDRSAVNTLAQARGICNQLKSPWVGIALDVYHVWWDDRLEQEIAVCGREKTLFAFHVCDWITPTKDLLNDRGLMGEGCIPIRQIRGWMEDAGFGGFIEVEIFSQMRWSGDQAKFLEDIKSAYLRHI